MNPPSKLIRLGMVGLILGVMATAAPAAALDKTTSPTAKESLFCTNLPTLTTKVTTDINNLKAKITDAQAKRDQQLAANRAKWDQEITASRAKWDSQRQSDFAKLEAKAKTADQTAAVNLCLP